MTLAVAILFFGIFSLTSVDPGLLAQPAPRSSTSGSSGSTSATQQQPPQPQSAPEGTKSASPQPSGKSSPEKPKPAGAKKTRHKKKVTPSGCDPATASATTPGSNAATSAPQDGGAQDPPGNAPEPSKPCPPPKIVVRQGGITEQSIQLAGGSGGDQEAQKRDAANKMLAATQENLKQTAGRQLSTAQQESVSQILQFVDQSRSALAAGDLERAKTLAWKAQLLSEDLIKPQK